MLKFFERRSIVTVDSYFEKVEQSTMENPWMCLSDANYVPLILV